MTSAYVVYHYTLPDHDSTSGSMSNQRPSARYRNVPGTGTGGVKSCTGGWHRKRIGSRFNRLPARNTPSTAASGTHSTHVNRILIAAKQTASGNEETPRSDMATAQRHCILRHVNSYRTLHMYLGDRSRPWERKCVGHDIRSSYVYPRKRIASQHRTRTPSVDKLSGAAIIQPSADILDDVGLSVSHWTGKRHASIASLRGPIAYTMVNRRSFGGLPDDSSGDHIDGCLQRCDDRAAGVKELGVYTNRAPPACLPRP